MEVSFYEAEDGVCPMEQWLDNLRDRRARVRIKKRLDRIGLGNLGDHKSVGKGVMELRVDYGPGYRVYFARSGPSIVLLLCGGDKSTQDRDILKAHHYWRDFQHRYNANS